MKHIYIPLLLILTSCGPSVKFQRCSEGNCKVLAKFQDVNSCEKYAILHYTYLNYEELLRKGSAIITYEKYVTDATVSCVN